MRFSLQSVLVTLHLVCLLAWCLALIHRATRGDIITGHTLRKCSRGIGLLGTLLAAIWLLHLNTSLLMDSVIQGAGLLMVGLVTLDHLVFNRPPAGHLMRLVVGLAFTYVILLAMHG